ncbi:MAG: isoprenylcysteine carboxylmethyltransferase family protein [Armatimonadetes bacterium]|nr:isoprenylcysteine carboxylmethyltransferase family protein [Armatimonadota bacterium]
MTVSVKKAIVGLAISVVAFGFLLPLAFWLLATAIDRAFGWNPILSKPISQILTAASALIGMFWISWSYSYLVFVGRGLPQEAFGIALHPTEVLVTTGPYAYTRHPMVIGILFVLLAVTFLEQSIAGLILLPVVAVLILAYELEFEERGLARRFGADYEEYRRNVPMLIPRLEPYVHEPAAAG